MGFYDVLEQVMILLQRQERVSYQGSKEIVLSMMRT